MSKVTVDRRLWLTADGSLVEDGDPAAAFLWAPEGRQVAAEVAAEVGYQPVSVDPPDVDDTAEDNDESDGTCAGVTAAGDSCQRPAGDDGYCHLHRP